MNILKITTVALAISLAASSALAATDSGAFVKLGAGYGMNFKDKAFEAGATKAKHNGAIGEVAVGYNLDKNFAVDFSVANSPKYQVNTPVTIYNSHAATGNVKESVKGMSFMINGTYYADFGTTFKPFITAGLGYGKVKNVVTTDITVTAGGAKFPSSKKISKSGIAGMIGVGVAAPITDNISAEIAYKISSTAVKLEKKLFRNQSIVAGVKFSF